MPRQASASAKSLDQIVRVSWENTDSLIHLETIFSDTLCYWQIDASSDSRGLALSPDVDTTNGTVFTQCNRCDRTRFLCLSAMTALGIYMLGRRIRSTRYYDRHLCLSGHHPYHVPVPTPILDLYQSGCQPTYTPPPLLLVLLTPPLTPSQSPPTVPD